MATERASGPVQNSFPRSSVGMPALTLRVGVWGAEWLERVAGAFISAGINSTLNAGLLLCHGPHLAFGRPLPEGEVRFGSLARHRRSSDGQPDRSAESRRASL